jgi:site-specific DNA-methyltransferase (adenine-specific)
VIPRAGWEPWGIYRKPISEKTVAKNLRRWGAGALRRSSLDSPFSDVIDIGRTSQIERDIAGHPSQKPLALMHILTRASLPLGTGVILDPFAGSGSTIAAAEIQGLTSIGIERDKEFYEKALVAIPHLTSNKLNKIHQIQLCLTEERTK